MELQEYQKGHAGLPNRTIGQSIQRQQKVAVARDKLTFPDPLRVYDTF
jgi:hypothetical protein